jgi:hypothetical protein
MDSHTDSVLKRLEVVKTCRRCRWSNGVKERILLESVAGQRQISAMGVVGLRVARTTAHQDRAWLAKGLEALR